MTAALSTQGRSGDSLRLFPLVRIRVGVDLGDGVVLGVVRLLFARWHLSVAALVARLVIVVVVAAVLVVLGFVVLFVLRLVLLFVLALRLILLVALRLVLLFVLALRLIVLVALELVLVTFGPLPGRALTVPV